MKTVLALIAFVGVLIYCAQTPPNALQIRYDNQIRIVRHPQPERFREGQPIRYRLEDGSYTKALVISPVSINYRLPDDELSADQQVKNIQIEQPESLYASSTR